MPALKLAKTGLYIDEWCVRVAGDLVTGALLSQIDYWYKKSKKDGLIRVRGKKKLGHYWIAKTREEWMDDIYLTPDQYRRALKVLKNKGLIEVKQMPFAGRNVSHIRLLILRDQWVAHNPSPYSEGSSLTLEQGIIPHSIQIVPTESTVQYKSESDPETEKNSGEDGEEDQSTEISTEICTESDFSAKSPGKVLPMPGIKQVLQDLQDKKAKKSGKMPAFAVWQRAMALSTGKTQALLTLKDRAQLKSVERKVGGAFADLVTFVVEGWQKFAARAGNESGTTWPSEPHIGFFMKHAHVAITMRAEKTTTPVQSSAEKKTQTSYVVVAPKEEVHHLSDEELASMLKGLK